VVLLARGAAVLHARAAELPGAIAIPCDVTDASAVAGAAARIRDALGDAPDILVSNAGLFAPTPITALTPERFVETVRVNLVAPFLVLHEFLPRMRERGSGHVITIGSVADRVPFAENGAYAASKYGARALHEVLRLETRGSGVRATLVSPGPTDTAMWDDVDTTRTPGRFPPREAMLSAAAVAEAVLWAVLRPASVNVDELRLSRS
jgi:NADP-dependent 3-hydroxy acid dehydrogenase YdfG